MDQAIAGAGVVVCRIDPRSASGKGACSAWTAYKQLGVQELKDLEDAVDWLTTNSWVDASRIGLSGHSYGGFMTAFALTHSKKFAAGIAGAPVTDWRNYDSIYTERYMSTPQENPQGYDATSVVKAAKNLHGRLLLLHGEMDDNVHVQNTLQLIDELQKAEKDFEVMIYPRARHGLGRGSQRQIVQFILKTMTGVEPKLPASGPPVGPRPKGRR
jgi:dipeptidyl-peptidase-4